MDWLSSAVQFCKVSVGWKEKKKKKIPFRNLRIYYVAAQTGHSYKPNQTKKGQKKKLKKTNKSKRIFFFYVGTKGSTKQGRVMRSRIDN